MAVGQRLEYAEMYTQSPTFESILRSSDHHRGMTLRTSEVSRDVAFAQRPNRSEIRR